MQTQEPIEVKRMSEEVARMADREDINVEAQVQESPLVIIIQEVGESHTLVSINNPPSPLFS